MKEGSELVVGLLKNISEIVKFANPYESMIESFEACVQSVWIKSGATLSLDVKTDELHISKRVTCVYKCVKLLDEYVSLNLVGK